MRIIPAIDVIDGKCVRLRQGDYGQKSIYRENPVEVALKFERAGLKYLHVVDLDGAKAGRVTNWAVVQHILESTNLIVDFGGGIKTASELKKLLDLGVQQVNLGSIAVKEPQLVKDWIGKFGRDQIILSADVRDRKIKINGWQEDSETTIDSLVQEFLHADLGFVACTDIDTDGMLAGPNIKLYRELKERFPKINWIASGGVSSIADVNALAGTGVDGVIIGKAIYEGKIQLSELANLPC